MTTIRVRRALFAAWMAVVAACGGAVREPASTVVRPGAPGSASRTESAAAPITRPAYTRADVHFMHGMIAHHQQALDMVSLVNARTAREDMRLLAQRIALSQTSEIERMQRWLALRSEPAASAQHMHMPGMLSTEELARLRAASGAEFDRLFLELMIRHHEGALEMVATLFATEGAGQEPEIFQFASDVDADQRAEIARMRRMQTPTP